MAAHYEYEFEQEYSPLHEGEMEDPFIGKAFKKLGGFKGLLSRAAPILKKLAPIAARFVAGAIPGLGAIAGPLAANLVGRLTQEQQQELEAVLAEAGAVQPYGESYYQQAESPYQEWGHQEFESPYQEWANPEFESPHQEWANPEFESPYHEYGQGEPGGMYHEMEGMYAESESEMHPEYEMGLPHSEMAHQEAALMELIAYEAAQAPSLAEAEALAGSLVPMASLSIRTSPAGRAAAPAVRAATPALTRATGRLVGALRGSPATAPLIPAVPTILRRTNAVIARAAAQGAQVTPRAAVRTMANQTFKVLGNPAVCISIIIRSGKMRRRARTAPMP
jgi:hypothetical protein